MIYHVHILKRPPDGFARMIEKRTLAARADDEAIRIAKENLKLSAPPTASGFSLRNQDGKEIYRWFKPVAQANGR
jgi:hypothetical protein